MTGPEYANAFVQKIKDSDISVMLEATVTKIRDRHFPINIINKLTNKKQYLLEVVSPMGAFKISAKAIVLAMGCRERPAGAINLCGTRPAGVLSRRDLSGTECCRAAPRSD